MKGILIDVQNRTVTEVEVETKNGNQLESMYSLLNCDLVDVVRFDRKNDIFVDDEGLLKLTDDSKFFRLKGYPQPLCGNGLVIGINNETGETIDTTLTIEDIENVVEFMDMNEVLLRYEI